MDDPYTKLAAGHGSAGPFLRQRCCQTNLVEEFGACSEEMPETDVPRWLEKTAANAIDQGVSWFTWWEVTISTKVFNFIPSSITSGC